MVHVYWLQILFDELLMLGQGGIAWHLPSMAAFLLISKNLGQTHGERYICLLQDSKFAVCQTLITGRTIAICWHCGRNNGTGFRCQKNMPFYEVL
jgi:hypothetical protein